MPMSPEQQAMYQGKMDGLQAGQSMGPSAFQPKGRASNTNPFEGALSLLQDRCMELASGVGNQGDKFRDCKNKLLKIAYDLGRINSDLTDIATGEGEEDNGGY